jgi:hypothetical protein
MTVFAGEIYRAPRSWAERAYRKLIYFNEVDEGGHFAAWEQLELISAEMRAAFRSQRQSGEMYGAHAMRAIFPSHRKQETYQRTRSVCPRKSTSIAAASLARRLLPLLPPSSA